MHGLLLLLLLLVLLLLFRVLLIDVVIIFTNDETFEIKSRNIILIFVNYGFSRSIRTLRGCEVALYLVIRRAQREGKRRDGSRGFP